MTKALVIIAALTTMIVLSVSFMNAATTAMTNHTDSVHNQIENIFTIK